MKAPSPIDPATGISGLKFVRRRESWVAKSSGCFYKIIRRSDDPQRDLSDPTCIETARREYADMQILHELSDRVCLPARLEHACIVYPLLTGPDMRTVLMNKAAHAQHEACLREAMGLLARLHHGKADLVQYPAKDYRRNSFLPPDRELLERMEQRKRTLVVTGFEARNFRFDANRAAWFFFDPHHVWLGYPEEDFARFLISLLMIRGRRRGPRPWTDFDRFRLLSTYEETAPANLDRKLLNYFLHEQLAKRRFYAMRKTRPAPLRFFSDAYTRIYYRQLRRTISGQQF